MKHNSNKQGALSGIRILDLTRVLAGPFCTMLMGDMGAEIIKIESPGHGDDSRKYPPFIRDHSIYFMNLNRNKKSVTLNLKDSRGRGVFFDLVENSDVVIENFRPGTMEKLGIGYAAIKERNPNIIYASVSGFGHTGPYKDMPGYDIIGQAMGGIMSITGWPDSPPTRTGTAIADILAGLFTCIGVLSSLIANRSGKPGQKVDVALVDSVVSAMETIIQIYLVEKREPQRIGNRYEFIYPYDTFKAKNGWVVIAVGNDKLWKVFCKAIGREDLLSNDAFADNYSRVKNYQEIGQIVEEWTSKKDVRELVDYFLPHKIPCAPLYSVKDVVADPHIAQARRMIREVEHPIVGNMKVIGSPIHLSETPPTIGSPAPMLGEHSREILREILTYSENKISALEKDKIIG